MRKSNSDFNSSFVLEAGTFISNKGYFAYVELDDIACWVGADGLDSDEEKESAKLAVHRVFEDFMDKPSMSRRKIKQYLNNAHNVLKSESRDTRLKASLIMLVTDYSKIVWAVAGNTRLYLFRKGIFNFRSKDMSIAQLLADSGKIIESEINEHDERHNLTEYLGKTSGFNPFVSRPYRLVDGDVMLICNAGFWENVSVDEISEALRDTKESADFVDNLEEMLLAKQNEVLNNYLIAAVFGNKVFHENTIDYKKIALKVASVVLPIILMVGIGLVVRQVMEKSRIREEQVKKAKLILTQKKSIEQLEKKGDQLIAAEKYQEAAAQYNEALDILSNALDDPKKAEKIEQKNKITMLMVEGDNFSAGEEYARAMEKYTIANQKATGTGYDKAGIMARISKTRSIIEIQKLIKEGDDNMIRENFVGAKDKYSLAKGIAEQISMSSMVTTLDAKLSNAEQKNTDAIKSSRIEAQREQSIYQAKRMEKDGDEKYSAKKWKAAMESYQIAKRSYEALGMSQEVLIVDSKLKNATNNARPLIKKIFGMGKQ
jgi:serine/threonine protein phosphatase PrpC